ncbi:hypothetical protein SELMODRAFT_423493 [Selaginella moellendorffii]|uniref:Uncharacterized protein n=1 Tax=Selaginella moellendorffii TaxID=88036 RepID=D8SLW2_SELML|nr:hypothetical protein SELMODRAFT_423493 [Selaginella moellendorffii]
MVFTAKLLKFIVGTSVTGVTGSTWMPSRTSSHSGGPNQRAVSRLLAQSTPIIRLRATNSASYSSLPSATAAMSASRAARAAALPKKYVDEFTMTPGRSYKAYKAIWSGRGDGMIKYVIGTPSFVKSNQYMLLCGERFVKAPCKVLREAFILAYIKDLKALASLEDFESEEDVEMVLWLRTETVHIVVDYANLMEDEAVAYLKHTSGKTEEVCQLRARRIHHYTGWVPGLLSQYLTKKCVVKQTRRLLLKGVSDALHSDDEVTLGTPKSITNNRWPSLDDSCGSRNRDSLEALEERGSIQSLAAAACSADIGAPINIADEEVDCDEEVNEEVNLDEEVLNVVTKQDAGFVCDHDNLVHTHIFMQFLIDPMRRLCLNLFKIFCDYLLSLTTMKDGIDSALEKVTFAAPKSITNNRWPSLETRDIGCIIMDIAHLCFVNSKVYGWSNTDRTTVQRLLVAARIKNPGFGATTGALQHMIGVELVNDISRHGSHLRYWSWEFERLYQNSVIKPDVPSKLITTSCLKTSSIVKARELWEQGRNISDEISLHLLVKGVVIGKTVLEFRVIPGVSSGPSF